MGLFAKFKEAWLKPMSFDSLNEGFYDDLEEALILADVGMDTAVDAVAQLKKRAYAKLLTHEEDVKNALRDILAEKLSVGDPALDLSTRPSVALIIGVNGVGKTTSIGKLAHRLKNEGKKVLLCAGDTFRAAAADQLEIWAERAGVDIVRQNEGADPGAVLFDSLAAAKARRVRRSAARRDPPCTGCAAAYSRGCTAAAPSSHSRRPPPAAATAAAAPPATPPPARDTGWPPPPSRRRAAAAAPAPARRNTGRTLGPCRR